ncbi:phage tail tape measure protein [Methylomonas sp. EFPC1]|uniref:phage tail tape measure protein n=1 Tax=Methylomonas sp. EFPC1 TaxID=2812647 RepID=UPI00196762C0|nr:phage tail tape measure protein [Methylomonas sp. EFPC1]QSB01970.1 phage tail tape measure protein [Methylomonas sp. EFPC1]
MSQALHNLTFMVSLLDKVSGPAGAMMKTMDNVTTRIQAGYRKIGYGIAGVVGTGYALDNILAPTKEMQAALGQVKSLDVTDDVLSQLTKTALKFSTQYGESAADFVKSSYEIKGAIDTLSGDDLPKFTYAAGVLAKGTKANVGEITNYFGTMYGIFKDTAETMGKAQWIEQLTGQTALAVKIFKTDGAGISQAFTTLGAEATAANVPIAEQFGVLGRLLATMPGGEAGTKYRAFLHGVGNAQDKLGLKFTDSFGHMLPMVDILNKIKGKFGDLGKVETADLIKKAFGSDEAVALVKLLAIDIGGLNDNIKQIGNQTGMQNAIEMAQTMTMGWDRATQGVNALKIALGLQLMPTINVFFDKINGGIQTLLRWSELFPELTRWVSLGALGIFGLIAGVSLLSIVMGVATVAGGGFAVIMAVLSSPITGIALAIAAVGYQLYRFINYSRDLVGEYQVFESIFSGWETVQSWVTGVIEYVMNKFEGLKAWFKNFNLWEFLLSGVDALIGKINMIPGINIDLGGAPKPIAAPAGLNGGGSKGGLMNKFSTMNNNQNQSRSIGTVQINNYESKRSLSQLVDDVMMAGG